MNNLCSRPEMKELSEMIGDFIRYWGFKQIHGRIWCLIYLSKDPLDAGDLMNCLGVSKALMSLSLKDLLEYNVIEEGPKTAKGTQSYHANPDVLAVITNVLRTRERKMLAQIKTAQNLVSDLPESEISASNISTDRLKQLGNMIEEAQDTLDGMLSLATINLKDWDKING